MKRDDRVLYLAAAWCLAYPDETLLSRLPLLRQGLAQYGGPRHNKRAAALFEPCLHELETTPLMVLQQRYVDVFDLSRKHALYLSYWTDGDTRRRGEVLGEFKQLYRRSGFLVNTGGELPDYVPMVLEFAARVDVKAGVSLLLKYRPSLELLRIALEERRSVHGAVVAAVCATFPGTSPADRQAVMRMAGFGPPTESVGLEPYDPRLLPLHEGSGSGPSTGTGTGAGAAETGRKDPSPQGVN